MTTKPRNRTAPDAGAVVSPADVETTQEIAAVDPSTQTQTVAPSSQFDTLILARPDAKTPNPVFLGDVVLVQPRQLRLGADEVPAIVTKVLGDTMINATLFAVGQGVRAVTAPIPHMSRPDGASAYVWRHRGEAL